MEPRNNEVPGDWKNALILICYRFKTNSLENDKNIRNLIVFEKLVEIKGKAA